MDSKLHVTVVYEALREDILHGRLAPAERLVTQRLAERIGVSRTPVKEALAHLESEGLVERQGNWGFVVRTISMRDAEELFEGRLVIETAVARFAAERASAADLDALNTSLAASQRHLEAGDLVEFQRASRAFHEHIALAAANDKLVGMFRQLNDLVLLFGLSLLKANPARAQDILTENRSIADAIERRDAEAAENWMRRHIESGHASFRGSVGRIRSAVRAA